MHRYRIKYAQSVSHDMFVYVNGIDTTHFLFSSSSKTFNNYQIFIHMLPYLYYRYEKRRAEECEQCVPPWTVEAFLYPLRGSIPADLQAENLAMFLSVVGIIIGFWLLSRPWWHKHHAFM